MLPRIRLIQVGDVHLPTAARSRRSVDDKDNSFPLEVKNIISAVPIKTVFKKIHHKIQTENIDSLIFMGDLTDLGDVQQFDGSVSYIANSLQVGRGRRNQNQNVGIVPGNHDINRELAKNPSFLGKFLPLVKSMQNHNLPNIPVEETLFTRSSSDPGRVLLALANSCWGCGSQAYVHKSFRDKIESAIESVLTEGDQAQLRSYYDGQLDTPAFSAESIDQILNKTALEDDDTVIIIAAHHNILPQRVPRLAPYTELVNSGSLRSSLVDCPKSVLYLHGHIHQDPIEIVSNSVGDKLICISAPQAEDGFNVVEIVFTNTGAPLKCRIVPWRFNNSNILAECKTIEIAIRKNNSTYVDSAIWKLYEYLVRQKSCFWGDIDDANKKMKWSMASDKIEEILEILQSDRKLIIENYDAGRENWILRVTL